LINNATVQSLAKKKKKSTAQILLRWALQNHMVILPKSQTPERIIENAKIFDFELSLEEMEILDIMDRNKHYCWDPTHLE